MFEGAATWGLLLALILWIVMRNVSRRPQSTRIPGSLTDRLLKFLQQGAFPWTCAAAATINSGNQATNSFRVAFYIRSFGYTTTQASVANLALSLTVTLGVYTGGWLADKIARAKG